MRIMMVRRRTAALGEQAVIVAYACCVAVPGSTLRGSCALRNAVGTVQGTEATSTDSGSPGRLHLESLPPYLRDPRDGSPWSIFLTSQT